MLQPNQEIVKIARQIIRERRAIYPHSFTAEKIDKDIINELLLDANYAPTHRLTQPWRFKVIQGQGLADLGSLLAGLYREKVAAEAFSERKYSKTLEKPRLCSHVIAICMQRDPQERLPEWEEVAATAMSVQNLWLSASAYGIGAYWSSPSTINTEACRKFLKLKEGQRCLGFFYMGYHNMEKLEVNRSPISDKVEWL